MIQRLASVGWAPHDANKLRQDQINNLAQNFHRVPAYSNTTSHATSVTVLPHNQMTVTFVNPIDPADNGGWYNPGMSVRVIPAARRKFA